MIFYIVAFGTGLFNFILCCNVSRPPVMLENSRSQVTTTKNVAMIERDLEEGKK